MERLIRHARGIHAWFGERKHAGLAVIFGLGGAMMVAFSWVVIEGLARGCSGWSWWQKVFQYASRAWWWRSIGSLFLLGAGFCVVALYFFLRSGPMDRRGLWLLVAIAASSTAVLLLGNELAVFAVEIALIACAFGVVEAAWALFKSRRKVEA